MASNLIGYTSGTAVKFYSSMDERVIGKLTDRNHLQAMFNPREPAKYDKNIIDLWSQTAKNSSDFQQMLMASKPFEIPRGKGDTFQWDVTTMYQYPKIVAVPDSTRTQTNIGLDGEEFELVFDKPHFYKGQVITADPANGQEIYIKSDGEPYSSSATLYRCLLVPQVSGQTEFVDKRWIAEGREYMVLRHLAGEFTLEGAGLGPMGNKITLMESLGAGARKTHTITGWAEDQGIDPSQELIVYQNWRRNEQGVVTKAPATWEPFIEKKMRDELMKESTISAIWAKGGAVPGENGHKQEQLRYGTGLYWRMKNNGNYVPFNKGEFSINLLRNVFGDMFEGRVSMGERRVKIFTNEAGFRLFDTAAKKDMLGSGITLTDMGTGNGFIQGTGQNRMLSFGFDRVMTRETGIMSLSHLSELDYSGPNSEFGQQYHRVPRFMVFDITPANDGMPQDNVRIIRRAGTPNIKWGYLDGLTSHLGPMASQGHSMGMTLNAYRIDMETRWDVFVEDATKCVLIEQVPQY